MRTIRFALAAFLTVCPGVVAKDTFVMSQVTSGAGICTAGDFDADGRADLAHVVKGVVGQVRVILADEDGGFLEPGAPATAPATIVSLQTCDLNGDGFADIVGHANTFIFTMLGDGLGGLASVASVSVNSSTVQFATGDYDSDGFLDVLVFAAPKQRWLLRGDGAGHLASQGWDNVGYTGLPFATDIDADGHLDVVVAATTIRTMFGDGAGGLSNPVLTTVSFSPTNTVADDFDSDGRLDLGLYSLPARTLTLAFCGPGGSFTIAPEIHLPDSVAVASMSFAAGDVNGDRVADVVGTGMNGGVTLLRGDGLGSLGPPEHFVAGFMPTGVVLADFDGDGDADAAVRHGGAIGDTPIVSVLLGDPVTGFRKNDTFAMQKRPAGLAHGDLDEDGDDDLVVALHDGASARVVFCDDDGGFTMGPLLGAGTEPHAVLIDDFTNDGHRDVVISSAIAGAIHVFPGDGTGQFGTPQTIAGVGAARGMTAAHLNADSWLDLAVTVGSGGFRLFFGTPSGLVQGAAPFIALVQRDVAAADIDSDLDQDLALADEGVSDFAPGVVHLYTNNGTGAVTWRATLALGAFARTTDVAMHDFDGDGDADLAALSSMESRLYLFVNDGAGSFAHASPWFHYVDCGGAASAPGYPGAAKIEVADIDSDSDPDLVVVGELGGVASVLRSDGHGNFTTQRFVTGSIEPTSLAVFDANRDGRLDVVTSDFTSVSLTLLKNELPALFEGVGIGCAGSGGFVPRLALAGSPISGGFVSLTIDDAVGGAFALVVFGGSFAPVPITPSCALWTSPIFAPTLLLPLAGVGPGAGSVSIGGTLPPVPAVDVYTQAFVGDQGAPAGIAGTAAVLMHVQ